MKTVNRYYVLMVVLLLTGIMVSCQENDIYDSNHRNETINLQADIVHESISRANDSGFADSDKIGVFVVDYNGSSSQPLKSEGNHADNVLFSFNEKGGIWMGSTQLYWTDKTTPIDIYGYYPFDSSLKDVSAYPFSVQRNQRDEMGDGYMKGYSGYQASDFLWSKVERVYPTDATITMHYNHILAGIKVSLIPGEGFDENEWNTLEKIVLVENTYSNAFINLADGNVMVDNNSQVKAIIPQNYNSEFRAIVVPQKVEAGKQLISITIDGRSYVFSRQESMNYQAGKLHKFTFEVNRKHPEGKYEFNLLDEAITQWENDPLSHDGAAREYITVHINEGEYIGDVIAEMGLDPKEIRNLKLTGVLSEHNHFKYIRDEMPFLKAIHMKHLRTKQQEVYETWGECMEMEYGYWSYEDDFIPRFAFENMSYLSYVVWPDKLRGISQAAFAGTNLRGSMILPEGLTYIGNDCFYAYEHMPTSLTGELYIPSTVDYIGSWAFRHCNFTSELVLPGHMKFLGENAFGDCRHMTGQIRIPEGLDVLNAAWKNMEKMTGPIIVPQGIKIVNGVSSWLGEGDWDGHDHFPNVTSLYLPEGVQEIGYGAFAYNETLSGGVKIPNSVKKIAERAFLATNINKISLPEGLDAIEYESFKDCENLQDTLLLPSSVLQVKERAFYNCNKLNAIILPEKLEEIQNAGFANCHSLSYIQCLNPVPPTLSGTSFDGVEKDNFTVVVPEGSLDAYRNAEGWREFKRISTYYNFVCRPMSAKLLNKGDTRTIILNADDDWEVTHYPSWVDISAVSGYKKTELEVIIDELADGAGNRCDSIVFTLKNKKDHEGKAITTYYKITQLDSEYKENSRRVLQTATKGKGINIVFTADGYDAEDIADGSYIADIQEGMEYFFAIEPYMTYKDYFNVFADIALSYESGVCTTVNMWRDTKFKTTYGAGSSYRLKVDPVSVMNFVLNEVDDNKINPQNISQSLVICILNSDVYEGICALYADGSAVAFVPHSRWEFPNDYRGIIQHEAGGHGFGKLADEYIYHRDHILRCTCTCCEHVGSILHSQALGWYRNISLSGKYSEIEWNHLIFHANYDDIVDIYEGGFFHGRGVYRSEYNSCMNNNVPYYSTISRQAIVERIMDYAGEIFDFENFVSKDSRAMGDKFIVTRNVNNVGSGTSLHNPAPFFIEGSPMDYIQ